MAATTPTGRRSRGLMTRARRACAACAWMLLLAGATGCDADKSYSGVRLTDGRATYESTAEGLALSGQLTMLVKLDQRSFDDGDTSEVYLHELRFGVWQGYEVPEFDSHQITDVQAEGGLPAEATVGEENAVPVRWSLRLAGIEPADLCTMGMTAQVYLDLTDELFTPSFSSANQYDPIAESLRWSPDPCPHGG